MQDGKPFAMASMVHFRKKIYGTGITFLFKDGITVLLFPQIWWRSHAHQMHAPEFWRTVTNCIFSYAFRECNVRASRLTDYIRCSLLNL